MILQICQTFPPPTKLLHYTVYMFVATLKEIQVIMMNKFVNRYKNVLKIG